MRGSQRSEVVEAALHVACVGLGLRGVRPVGALPVWSSAGDEEEMRRREA